MKFVQYPMVRSEADGFWLKHCGFLDLSVEQFMVIQQSLLLQQLQEIADCPLSRRLLGKKAPETMDEFRRSIPLTTYEDYLPHLQQGNEDCLPDKPRIWAHTSDSSGFKHVPYTPQFYDRTLDNLMAAFVLACSKSRGQSSLAEGDHVLFNVAPLPYMSGILAHGASQRFNLKPVISPDVQDSMDFKEKVTKGFEVALQSGVDIIIGMASVLVKMGKNFENRSNITKSSNRSLHPGTVYRYTRALLKSKSEKRDILPKDLWPAKAIIGWGIDISIYRDDIYKYWGKYPYEFHACTEAGIIALQSWNKRGLTFIPDSNFYEFIPENEWLKSKESGYQPRTVLLSEVKPGELYELVITSFYRMPFIRYRLGHLVRITELEDKQAGIALPQMVFEARADDVIDIAGFTRISEKTVAQAIAMSGLKSEGWLIRKEMVRGEYRLHLYIEADEERDPAEAASIIDQQIKNVDRFYSDLHSMMDIHPLEVTFLRRGTFNDYYEDKKKAGAELHERKPTPMNTPDEVVNNLLSLSAKSRQPRKW